MGKDSKLGIEGYWIVAAFLLIVTLVFSCEDSEAAEIEVGPTLLSGEFAEGGALIFNSELNQRWYLGGGYISHQQCHCSYPTGLEENIFFHIQRRARWRLVEVGLGPAYFQNTNRALGKNLTWSLSLGLAGEHWSIRFRHFSNAGSGSPNLGQDMLTIGYAF